MGLPGTRPTLYQFPPRPEPKFPQTEEVNREEREDQQKRRTASTGTIVTYLGQAKPEDAELYGKVAAAFAHRDLVPQAKKDYFQRMLADPKYFHEGWKANVKSVEPIVQGYQVVLDVQARLYLRTGRSLIYGRYMRETDRWLPERKTFELIRSEEMPERGVPTMLK